MVGFEDKNASNEYSAFLDCILYASTPLSLELRCRHLLSDSYHNGILDCFFAIQVFGVHSRLLKRKYS